MATIRAIGGKCRALMAAAAKTSASSSSSPTVAASSKPTPLKRVKRTPSPANAGKGILKPLPISPALSGFIGGAPEASRTDAIKKVWDYIKLHNLQNPTNKREIICDEKLKALFNGKDKVGFLEIASLLSQHFVKTG